MKTKIYILIAVILIGELSCFAQSSRLPFVEIGKTYEIYLPSDSVMSAIKSPGKCTIVSHGVDSWYEIELTGMAQDIGGNKFTMKKRLWMNFSLVLGIKQIEQKQ
jgi:hypothetical protein